VLLNFEQTLSFCTAKEVFSQIWYKMKQAHGEVMNCNHTHHIEGWPTSSTNYVFTQYKHFDTLKPQDKIILLYTFVSIVLYPADKQMFLKHIITGGDT
jgi:hypothetical protein